MQRIVKTACKEQGKAIMDASFAISVILKAVLLKTKRFSLKSAFGNCVSRCLKNHSTVVDKIRKKSFS